MKYSLSAACVSIFLMLGVLGVCGADDERLHGHSLDHPIVINAASSFAGMLQEYTELDNRFGNYKVIQQSLLFNKGRAIDLIQIESDGKLIEIYFDVSSWWRKP